MRAVFLPSPGRKCVLASQGVAIARKALQKPPKALHIAHTALLLGRERGNFQQVTRTILDKIDAAEDAKHSYRSSSFFYTLPLWPHPCSVRPWLCHTRARSLLTSATPGSYDDYTFHMIVEQGIIYLAMSSKHLDRKVNFCALPGTKALHL